MKASAFLYPWDVVGDPDAAARIADLGVRQVTLAAAYHSTRALTPRHPRHRIVTAEHAAVLYPVDERRWSGRALRPYAAGAWAPGDAYGRAAEVLAAVGLDVHSWVVLAHNSRLGAEHPETSVVNAYGDRYPWAPCIARPEVRAYLVALAAEAAVRPGARGTELESCGWYGLAHLHAHDKIAGVELDEVSQYLMSLCFCGSCRSGYAEVGLDAVELRAAVRGALDAVWRGAGATGQELLEATVGYRAAVARRLQEEVVAAVRVAAAPGFQVLLHADPRVYRCGANVGVDPAGVFGVADGVVVPCVGGAVDLLAPFAPYASGAVLAANFTVVAGMGGRPGALSDDAARAAASGATELRLYHAGLASEGDLGAVRRSGALD
ncbi:hypothetical protein [Streptomyces sp. CBMA152]|uniref:hypothetical protein n=1 Tax=Streptomyces sp. CBMA152 TaxID=1896312 RepID=UPI00166068FB|nr:hypothetical protein [Streptomyces sp. CBMA152]MBD0743633.1 hypothetical protein [Streptomyces sp. CBMA152]